MTNTPPPAPESLLMRILVAVDWHERTAFIDFATVGAPSDTEAQQTLKRASLALAQSLALPETRQHFGECAGADSPDDFATWLFVSEMNEATHAFVFDVSKPSEIAEEHYLDFDVVVGERDDSFRDLKAASEMLTRFVKDLQPSAESQHQRPTPTRKASE